MNSPPLWRTMQTVQNLTKTLLEMPGLAASGAWAVRSGPGPLETSTKVRFQCFTAVERAT